MAVEAADAFEAAGAHSARGWRARLSLVFRAPHGRTIVAERSHFGPLCIQRPFHPEGGACHVYVLHPPGGLAGGDHLEIAANVETGGEALITTPAATKVYRSAGDASVQGQTLHVAAGASLEWLPCEQILFGASRARLRTQVTLDGAARFIGWESVCLGRPTFGDTYRDGWLDQRTRISVDGRPVLVERTVLEPAADVLTRPWGLGRHTVFAALYAYPADDAQLTVVRSALAEHDICAGATRLDHLLVVRALAARAEPLRAAWVAAWAALRPGVIGREPCVPCIWRT